MKVPFGAFGAKGTFLPHRNLTLPLVVAPPPPASAPKLSNVEGEDWLLYSVFIQSAERAMEEMQISSNPHAVLFDLMDQRRIFVLKVLWAEADRLD